MPAYAPTFHLLSFVDALGFANVIGAPAGEGAEAYFRLVEIIRGEWKSRLGKSALKVMSIGDSVVIASECDRGSETNAGTFISEYLEQLYHLCYATAELQSTFAQANIWTRGAITYDKLDFSPGDNRIVGQAFSRAVHLEKHVALFPRVILDGGVIAASGRTTVGDLVGVMNGRSRGKPVLYNYWDNKVVPQIEKDVPTFVDFARVPPEGVDQASFIRKLTDNLLGKAKEDVEHFRKYQWVAKYIARHIEVAPQASPTEKYNGWVGLDEQRGLLRLL